MSKSLKAYEELFEDLMEYTNFKSSDDIKTKNDLYDFFKQVREDSESKGRRFRISRLLFDRTLVALNIREREEARPIERKSEKVKRHGRMFKNYRSAKIQGVVVKHKEKDIYLSYSKSVKGRVYPRWRDIKGRFTKAPDE